MKCFPSGTPLSLGVRLRGHSPWEPGNPPPEATAQQPGRVSRGKFDLPMRLCTLAEAMQLPWLKSSMMEKRG